MYREGEVNVSDDVAVKLLKHDSPVEDEELVRDRETGVIHVVPRQRIVKQRQPNTAATSHQSARRTYD